MSTEDLPRRLTVFDVWGPARHQRRPPIARLLREATRLAWRAAPRDLAVIATVQTLSVFAVAAQVLIARSLLAGLLHADRAHQTASGLVPKVLQLAVVTAALGVAQAVAANRQRMLSERCARYGENSVIKVTGRVPLSAFDESSFHDQVARARVAVQRLPIIASGLAGLGRAVASALGALVALVALTPLFAPLLLLVAVPTWLATRARGRAFHRFATGFTPADRERQYVADLLITRDAAKEVRAFGLQDHLRARHDQLWSERISALAKIARRHLLTAVGADLIASTLVALTLLGLITLALDHTLSLASAGAAAAAIVLLAQRLALAASNAGLLSESALFLQDYLDLVEAGTGADTPIAAGSPSPATVLSESGRPPNEVTLADPGSGLHVRADHVAFTYPGAHAPTLHDVSLEIVPGQIVAVVGENGSGKSTLAKLLAGLYVPDSGQITWNGMAADSDELARVRDSVAVIFQDYLRYALPARDNIGLGDVSRLADRTAIERAATQAGAHGTVTALRDGYETLLGPEFLDGSDLSLGQWQRIALARAVFRDAPFIVLDEPTASLDADAEHALFQGITTLLAGRSVLLISHRLSSVRRADAILVMSEGRIQERGTHDELITAGGRYARMFALQAAPYR